MPIIGAIGMKRLTCYIPIEIPDHVLSNEESLQFSENLDKVEAEMEAAFGELNTAGIQALHNVLQHHLQENSATTSQSTSLDTPAQSESSMVDVAITDVNSGSTFSNLSLTAHSASNSSSTSTHDSTPPANILSSSPHLPDIDVPSLIEPLSHAAASQSKQNSASAQSFTWQIGKTEQRLVNGAFRKCCLGQGCFGKTGMKSNDNCSHKLCKTCCAMYQHEASTFCKEAGHKPSGKEPTTASGGSSLYTRTRPLQSLHYKRREHASIDHHQRLKVLQNQQTYANDVRKNVRIKFWDEIGQMDILIVESPTHPYFCINNCSVAVREALGATDGKLVRIFDPKTKTWVLEESYNKRLLCDGEILLVRSHSCATGAGMQEAEEEETHRQRPRKRKFDDDIQVISAPSTPSREVSCAKALSIVPKIKTEYTSHRVLTSSPPLHPPVYTLASIQDLSSSPDLPTVIVPTSRPSTPTPAPKVKRVKVVEEEQILDLTVPNSHHGAWPWKFYKGMHEGFMQLEKKGSKHDNVFPSTTAKTKASARAAWTAGTPELKAKFYNDPTSTWKAYINAVRGLHGGTIPSHSESKKNKKLPQALNVKHEVIELDLD
ncbi:hypothetical protein GGU10DRAFT_337608 [Lentinula aff. detonsa]|uniref:Uncharacterized protein n=1 Tax=Lentinula aff. detonsa TaxID=2804958 RepID=A0AA38NB20_9AGAR|nr:hypothetical protein GGU10DRAFT_337608 [Lentinula aff. detonsa]